jgi:ABC-type enterochelin transport system substrate-binding protein
MLSQVDSNLWQDLISELKTLQQVFGIAEEPKECTEVEEEISELEALIMSAGIPEDEHSQRALLFLERELAQKKAELRRLQ